jgi:hypothetical protein
MCMCVCAFICPCVCSCTCESDVGERSYLYIHCVYNQSVAGAEGAARLDLLRDTAAAAAAADVREKHTHTHRQGIQASLCYEYNHIFYIDPTPASWGNTNHCPGFCPADLTFHFSCLLWAVVRVIAYCFAPRVRQSIAWLSVDTVAHHGRLHHAKHVQGGQRK